MFRLRITPAPKKKNVFYLFVFMITFHSIKQLRIKGHLSLYNVSTRAGREGEREEGRGKGGTEGEEGKVGPGVGEKVREGEREGEQGKEGERERFIMRGRDCEGVNVDESEMGVKRCTQMLC